MQFVYHYACFLTNSPSAYVNGKFTLGNYVSTTMDRYVITRKAEDKDRVKHKKHYQQGFP